LCGSSTAVAEEADRTAYDALINDHVDNNTRSVKEKSAIQGKKLQHGFNTL